MPMEFGLLRAVGFARSTYYRSMQPRLPSATFQGVKLGKQFITADPFNAAARSLPTSSSDPIRKMLRLRGSIFQDNPHWCRTQKSALL